MRRSGRLRRRSWRDVASHLHRSVCACARERHGGRPIREGRLPTQHTTWNCMSVACCRLHVVCYVLPVACCVLHVVRCMLSVTCCLLRVACCSLHDAWFCSMLHVACCMWHVVRVACFPTLMRPRHRSRRSRCCCCGAAPLSSLRSTTADGRWPPSLSPATRASVASCCCALKHTTHARTYSGATCTVP